MVNNIWPKRLFVLDISRGFAALAVVLWHWQHFSSLSEVGFVSTRQPFYVIFKLIYERGDMGVQYFFLLSGFIFFWLYRAPIEDRSINAKYFWVQRISRLYPLHILTLLIVALLQAVYIYREVIPFIYPFNDTYHFFLNLVYATKWGFEEGWSFNAPTWSVSVEILLYFMFFMSAYARQGGAFFCMGVSVICYVITLFHYNEILNGMSLFFWGGVIFYATLLISTNRKLEKLRTVIYTVAMLSWALTIYNFYAFNLSDDIKYFFTFSKHLVDAFPKYILFPLTICSLALIEIRGGMGLLRSVSWIGDISYSSYLLHFPLQLIFALAVSYGILNSEFYLSAVYLLVFYSILIFLSYMSFIGFERPIQNIVRNKYIRRIGT